MAGTLADQMERLARLTRDVAALPSAGKGGARGRSGSGGGAGGRASRPPNFTTWSVQGTRPSSSSGVTFHFKHGYVSKKGTPSSGALALTSAGAHQEYIERPGAAERVAGADGDEREASFGTIGESKAERTRFWRRVEEAERTNGRVQCRMIVELPCEVDAAARERIARAFCAVLDERGLPYWCVIHAPAGHNDARNNHMHIAYSDRPSARTATGEWDFEIVRKVTRENRHATLARPYMRKKDRKAQGTSWVRHLREAFARVANAELDACGIDKRYDPRSYAESGIDKEPTLHLGPNRAKAEASGFDTGAGAENARREIRFRIESPVRRAERAAAYAEVIGARVLELTIAAGGPDAVALVERARARAAEYEALTREVGRAQRERESHRIGREAVGRRLSVRAAFVDKESLRLVERPRHLHSSDGLRTANRLFAERLLLDEARQDVAPFLARCDRVVAAQDVRLRTLDQQRAAALAGALAAEIALARAALGPAHLAEHAAEMERDHTAHGADPAILGRARALADTLAPQAVEDAKRKVAPVIPIAPEIPATPTAPNRPAKPRPAPTQADAEPREMFPGAFHLPAGAPPERTADLRRRIAALPDADLRYHEAATGDAAELCEDDLVAAGYRRALDVLMEEAKGRRQTAGGGRRAAGGRDDQPEPEAGRSPRRTAGPPARGRASRRPPKGER